jgi:hypothetical protein
VLAAILLAIHGKAVVRPMSAPLSLLKNPALRAAVRALPHSRTGGHGVRRDERHRGFCSGPPASSSSSPGVAAGPATKQKPRGSRFTAILSLGLGDASSAGFGRVVVVGRRVGSEIGSGGGYCFDPSVSWGSAST